MLKKYLKKVFFSLTFLSLKRSSSISIWFYTWVLRVPFLQKFRRDNGVRLVSFSVESNSVIEALKRRDGWNPGGVGGPGGKTAGEFSGKNHSPFFQMAIQLHVKWWYSLTPPDTRDSSFVSFCIPRRPLFVTVSQRRVVLVSLSLLSHTSLCHPSGHCGSHLAALFYVPIVTGPSLSPVDVTRSTGTRSRRKRKRWGRVCSCSAFRSLKKRKTGKNSRKLR